MEKEIYVYVADSTEWYKDLYSGSEIGDIMDCAEAQGGVYTLPNFIKTFNTIGIDLSGESVQIRMAEYEGDEFIKEIK